MRLKTKLVLVAASLTSVTVLVVSGLFLSELLQQRIAQTAANTDLMERQVLQMTRQAIEMGLRANPPADASPQAVQVAVSDALREHRPLIDTMDALVKYSDSVQDVSVTDALGNTLVSTDPELSNQQIMTRMNFERMRSARVWYQARQVFGQARVLNVEMPLNRNGAPFLMVHLGLRSTFLRDNYKPWLKGALLLALLCSAVTMGAAGVIASLVLRPIEEISTQLERLTGDRANDALYAGEGDAVVRASESIEKLGRQIRNTEAGYSDLQTNLNRMLDTLRDGVVLFTAERRAVMVSDAVTNFAGPQAQPLAGQELGEIFPANTSLGLAVREAFQHEAKVVARTVRLEDGREIEFSLDRVDDHAGERIGTLLTLRDTGSAAKLEQELEVSRRLAAVGRLTAGVGHEVKNPINAMVVHLELLRSKLEEAGRGRGFLEGSLRHVSVLAGEMARLDRVVQTLADFTRPMELHVREMDLADAVDAVVELTSAEMAEHGVTVRVQTEPVTVRGDGEMLRQALLNLLLNGMQAMEGGGILQITLRRELEAAVIEVTDTGTGIAPELLPRIFDLYFTTKTKGSGIGLAMTYRIAQMHGGALDVMSEPGRGAMFTIRLPAVVQKRMGRAA